MNNKEIVNHISEAYGFLKKFVKVEETKLGTITKGIGTISYIEEVLFSVTTDKKTVKYSLATESGLKVVGEALPASPAESGEAKPTESAPAEKPENKSVAPAQHTQPNQQKPGQPQPQTKK